MNYDVDYFINQFESIPEENWCINDQINERGQMCAYGHILLGGVGGSKTFTKLMHTLPHAYSSTGDLDTGAQINNGNHPCYKQETPKQRILAALYNVKANQAVTEANSIINSVIHENNLQRL